MEGAGASLTTGFPIPRSSSCNPSEIGGLHMIGPAPLRSADRYWWRNDRIFRLQLGCFSLRSAFASIRRRDGPVPDRRHVGVRDAVRLRWQRILRAWAEVGVSSLRAPRSDPGSGGSRRRCAPRDEGLSDGRRDRLLVEDFRIVGFGRRHAPSRPSAPYAIDQSGGDGRVEKKPADAGRAILELRDELDCEGQQRDRAPGEPLPILKRHAVNSTTASSRNMPTNIGIVTAATSPG